MQPKWNTQHDIVIHASIISSCACMSNSKKILQGCIFCTRFIFSLAAKILIFFLILFFPARKGIKWKNIFRTLYFILIILPPTYFFSCFLPILIVFLIFPFFPPTKYYFLRPFSRVKFAEITPLKYYHSST